MLIFALTLRQLRFDTDDFYLSFVCHKSSYTLSRCRSRDANKLTRAQLCNIFCKALEFEISYEWNENCDKKFCLELKESWENPWQIFFHLDRKLVEQVKVLYWQTPTYITSIFRGFEIILVVKYHLDRSANIKYKMCTVYTTPIYIHSSPIWIIPWQNFIAKFHAKYYPPPPPSHTNMLKEWSGYTLKW